MQLPDAMISEGLKRSISSMLPWDIPWYDTPHAIFFGVLYSVLGIIGLGVLSAAVMAFLRGRKDGSGASH